MGYVVLRLKHFRNFVLRVFASHLVVTGRQSVCKYKYCYNLILINCGNLNKLHHLTVTIFIDSWLCIFAVKILMSYV